MKALPLARRSTTAAAAVLSLALTWSLVLAPATARAAPPSDASVVRLLAVTRAEALNDQAIQQVNQMVKPMMEQAVNARNLSPEQRQQADQFLASFTVKLNDIIAEELSWQRMRDMSVQIYRETFTQEEVDGLIAFYESALGQAFIEKMPVVLQKSMALTQQRMLPMMTRIQAAVEASAQEFKAGQGPRQ